MGSTSFGVISPNLETSLLYVNFCLESFEPEKRLPSFAKVMPRISPVERSKLKQHSISRVSNASRNSVHDVEESAAERTADLILKRVL